MERVARPWRWFAIAAGAGVLGAVVSSFWLRAPVESAAEPLLPIVADPSDDSGVAPSGQSLAASPERAKVEELRAMSETFRNTTFLIAIRDAGYRCSELVSVYGGVGDSTTWTVGCREMLAYAVSVNQTGTLLVEPTLHHIDGVFGEAVP